MTKARTVATGFQPAGLGKLETCRPRLTVNRWSAWAQSLASRHARLPQYAPLPLTLAGAAPSETGVQQYVRQLCNLSVRMRLVLGPVLVNLGWRMLAGSTRTIERIGRHEQRAPGPMTLFDTPQPVRGLTGQSVSRQHLTSPSAGEAEGLPPLVLVRQKLVASTIPQPTTALERAFTRQTTALEGKAGQGTLLQRAGEMGERVLRTHRRVEELPPGPRPRHTTKPEVGRSPTTEPRSVSRVPHGSEEHRRSVDSARTALDVDHLADQVIRRIDDRVTAFRERLGRAF